MDAILTGRLVSSPLLQLDQAAGAATRIEKNDGLSTRTDDWAARAKNAGPGLSEPHDDGGKILHDVANVM